jgi:glycosyltransferase 2 family protein
VSRGLSIALRAAVSALLVGWLATRVDLGEVVAGLAAVGPGTVVAIVALQLVNTGLKSYKWQRLLAADGIRITQTEAFASYMVGTFFNLFLPSSMGGDAVRAVDTARRSGRALATVTSVAADRVLGFTAIGAVGLVALASGAASALEAHERLFAALLYIGVAAVSVVAFTPWPLRLGRLVGLDRWPKLARVVAGVGESLAAYRRDGRLAELALLSIAAQCIVVAVVWMIGRSVGVAASLPYYFVAVPLVSLVESLPFTIYGIGVRDVSYVYLFGLVGEPEEKVLALSVLYVLLTVLYSLLGGVVFAFRSAAPKAASR